MGNFVLNLAPSKYEIQKPKHFNGESALAKGYKIKLCNAKSIDLELINGVSYEFATRLINQRSEIQGKADKLPFKEQYKAFEIIHGIGAKKAKLLNKYITLGKCN